MLLISVAVIGVVFAGYQFVRPFQSGVNELGRDVRDVLMGQSIGGVGHSGPTGGGAANGGTATAPSTTNTTTVPTGSGVPNDSHMGPTTHTPPQQDIDAMFGNPVNQNVRQPSGSTSG